MRVRSPASLERGLAHDIRIRLSIAPSSPAAYQRTPPGCQRDSTKGCMTEQIWLTTFGPEYSVRERADGEAIDYILKM